MEGPWKLHAHRSVVLQGKATWLQLLKNWFFSFFGNLAGSLFIVWVVDETYLFETGALAGIANAKAVAVSKTSAEFGTTVVRGLLCNWLVCSRSMSFHLDSKSSSWTAGGFHCNSTGFFTPSHQLCRG